MDHYQVPYNNAPSFGGLTSVEWESFAQSEGYELAPLMLPVSPKIQELLDKIDAELLQFPSVAVATMDFDPYVVEVPSV